MTITVLLPVWANDRADWLQESVDSVRQQVLQPSRTLIVVDGPVTADLHDAISTITQDPHVSALWLPVNVGLAEALNAGLAECDTTYVARLDADDQWKPNHLHLVMREFVRSPGSTLIGAQFESRTADMTESLGIRKVPQSAHDIRRFSRYRTPINHPTIVFRRGDVQLVGGYPTDVGRFEDWGLACRILAHGMTIRNISEVTLLVRTGDAVIARRSGLRYMREEMRAIARFAALGYISRKNAAVAVAMRAPLRLLPPSLMRRIYELLRH